MIRAFATTDVGNAERLVFSAGEDFRYIPAWGEYIVWSGRHWERDIGGVRMLRHAKEALGVIKRQASEAADEKKKKNFFKWYHQSQARSRLEAMVALARAETGVVASHAELDRKPWLLNVKNGTLDLKTGKLSPHAQNDMLTRTAPVKFDARAKAPRWDRFLKTVLPDPAVRRFVQKFIGYALTGQVTERMFVVFFGGGRNGKSVFLRVIQTMLGPYAASAAPGLLMSKETEGHPTEIADLFGIRLAIASEVKKGRTFDEEQVKRLTGNDQLKARRMREDYWEFEPTHKLMLAANHKPKVRDASDSFWDRIALIPFSVRIKDKDIDRDLLTKLQAELPGVLAWAVAGCALWRKEGLPIPEAVAAATKEYREGEDKVGRYLNERCVFGPRHVATNEELSKSIKRWCENNNVYIFSDKDLAERLLDRSCERRTNLGEKKQRGWSGVALKTSSNTSGDSGDVGDGKPPMTGNIVRLDPRRRRGRSLRTDKGGSVSPTSPTSPKTSLQQFLRKQGARQPSSTRSAGKSGDGRGDGGGSRAGTAFKPVSFNVKKGYDVEGAE